MRKLYTFSVKSSSKLFSCSTCAMYNRFNHAKKSLTLKSYLPGINTLIFPKRYDRNIFSEKLINELHAWIENHLHVINYPNVSNSLLVKTNGTFRKET